MATNARTRERQLEQLGRLQSLQPPPCIGGGFAEDALLHGGFSRDHNDFDLFVERSDLDVTLLALRALGYDDWETWGETATGEPFYLSKQADGMMIDICVTDRDEVGDLYFEVARVNFEVEAGAAALGYRVYLPADAYGHPPVSFEGIPMRCLGPLANYQVRAGIASRGTFGPLRPTDIAAMERLRTGFFPGQSAAELMPRVEPI